MRGRHQRRFGSPRSSRVPRGQRVRPSWVDWRAAFARPSTWVVQELIGLAAVVCLLVVADLLLHTAMIWPLAFLGVGLGPAERARANAQRRQRGAANIGSAAGL